MTTHLSARIAWHMDGWNGHVCRNPKGNTFCVGQYSFPGQMIAERRELQWEQDPKVAGQPIHTLDKVPPCIYSVNAFGAQALKAYSPPPSWFRDSTETAIWMLPGYTIATWPYEEMYKEEMRNPEGTRPAYDPVKRREAANNFYAKLAGDRSLIFYYANYSNPFSENDQNRYVIVGMSRIKTVGPEITWTNQSKDMEMRYGQYVWQRNITSHYPDQGLRLPYHLYMEQPDVLDKILFVPDNSRHFKYAARHISDDGALGLIERLSEIVGTLQELDDTSENWQARQEWLASVMAELWRGRGLYPGLTRVCDFIKFREAIPFVISQASGQTEQVIKDGLFSLIEGRTDSLANLKLSPERIKAIRREWQKLEADQQRLLRDVLPRFDVQVEQVEGIVLNPQTLSLISSHHEIADNPYTLAEQYIGYNADDQITLSQIDHGLFPSPELGQQPELEVDDWRRLRAFCIEQLQVANQHSFLPAEQVLDGLNFKLKFLPDWKRTQFTLKSLDIDREELSGALTFRQENEQQYLYRKITFEDEREVESALRALARRPDINLRSPVTETSWKNNLWEVDSDIAKSHPAEYEKAIANQIAVCQQIFRRPVSVVCGPAGTGKTTVVKAIIQAIEKAHGAGSSFQLLAPTGKAADRLRARTGKAASTMHSFLNSLGWLNDNLTFKRAKGKREDKYVTYIIDESSMLDLSMLATLFRAINWNAVQRLIFVGDPNQLPPIGTGKAFADLIDWLNREQPESVGELTTNMRQLSNRLLGRGTGIIDVASLYVRRGMIETKSADKDAEEELMLQRLQEGGEVSGDLRVLYWQTTDELEKLLLDTIVADMEKETNQKLDPNRPANLWDAYFEARNPESKPERSQVISPYRGELFGIENLNKVIQRHKSDWMITNKGQLAGITYGDKVIQVRNRPQSDPAWAYNKNTKKNERLSVYNGEIGLTKVHGYDHSKWTWSQFRLSRFQVVFSRKQDFWIPFDSDSEVEENLELAYAISVHKAQGSEFERVYFVLPKHKRGLLSRELFYTGITRAQVHSTLLIQEDIAPILSLRRPESSHLARINSSLFEFRPAPPELRTMWDWYEEGKIHRALTGQMLRSKSEVIIANILFEREIPFSYEVPLFASDGTFYLPDFTIKFAGEEWYWEHLGMLHNESYREHWAKKKAWYEKHGFASNLIITQEVGGFDSSQVNQLLQDRFGIS